MYIVKLVLGEKGLNAEWRKQQSTLKSVQASSFVVSDTCCFSIRVDVYFDPIVRGGAGLGDTDLGLTVVWLIMWEDFHTFICHETLKSYRSHKVHYLCEN
jgi:hypothetical protein